MPKILFPLLLIAVFVLVGCEQNTPVIQSEENVQTEQGEDQKAADTQGGHSLIEEDDSIWDVGEETGKPVLYLYPQEDTEVQLHLDYRGKITAEYPVSEKHSWTVLAHPDGTFSIGDREYPYLFWEGYSPLTSGFQFSEGFVVKREEAVAFLEEKLTLLGLNEKEQTDFITYWLPKMEENPYTMVRFLKEDYEAMAQWQIVPQPEQFIRVFVIMKGSITAPALPLQELSLTRERSGFTAVEWGGTYYH